MAQNLRKRPIFFVLILGYQEKGRGVNQSLIGR